MGTLPEKQVHEKARSFNSGFMVNGGRQERITIVVSSFLIRMAVLSIYYAK